MSKAKKHTQEVVVVKAKGINKYEETITTKDENGKSRTRVILTSYPMEHISFYQYVLPGDPLDPIPENISVDVGKNLRNLLEEIRGRYDGQIPKAIDVIVERYINLIKLYTPILPMNEWMVFIHFLKDYKKRSYNKFKRSIRYDLGFEIEYGKLGAMWDVGIPFIDKLHEMSEATVDAIIYVADRFWAGTDYKIIEAGGYEGMLKAAGAKVTEPVPSYDPDGF